MAGDLTENIRNYGTIRVPGLSYSSSGGSGGGGAPPGIFGSRPAPIPTPNPFGNLSGVYPNLTGANAAVSSAIMDELQGKLSPAAIAAIQDAGATYGVTSGMPGSGLAINRTGRDLGLATEQLIQHGLGDYASLIPTISATQTVNPALQAEIAATNAQNAAAPDPSAVESYAENLFNKYLEKMNGPGGGTGTYRGGTSSTLPWWQQAVNASGNGWGPMPTITRTFPGGIPGPGIGVL